MSIAAGVLSIVFNSAKELYEFQKEIYKAYLLGYFLKGSTCCFNDLI